MAEPSSTEPDNFGDCRYDWVDINGWRGEAEVRQRSILPRLNGKALSQLDEKATFSLQILLPCVCRGDLETLHAALTDADHSGHSGKLIHCDGEAHMNNFAIHAPIPNTLAENTVANSDTSHVASDGKREKVDPDFTCPFSGLSLLQYAILANHPEIIKLLLRHGADPNGGAEEGGKSLPADWAKIGSFHSPLYMAVYLRNVDSVSALVESGAKVTYGLWSYISNPESQDHCAKILEVLLDKGTSSIPVHYAIHIAAINDNLLPLLVRPGACHWHPGFYLTYHAERRLLMSPASRELLKTQAATAAEKLTKSLFIQLLLHWVTEYFSCGIYDASGTRSIHGCLSLLDVLIAEGANPLGWSVQRVQVIVTAWEQVARTHFAGMSPYDIGVEVRCPSGKIYPRRFFLRRDRLVGQHNHCATWDEDSSKMSSLDWNQIPEREEDELAFILRPCLLPAVGRVVQLHRKHLGGDDAVVRRLLQLANQCAPCVIQTPQQVPYSDGYLHHGPGCPHVSLSEEQRRISLRMCTYAGGHLPSLAARCRDVIFCVLLGRNFLQSVCHLPLPEKIKSYLISG